MRLLLRFKVTIVYALITVAAALLLAQLGPRVRWHVLHEASTNLHNLGDGHVATLVTSVFLTDGRVNWLWLASVAALFAVAEFLAGSRRFLVAFGAGHIGATALVAAGLGIGIHADVLADSLSMAIDVGVSYAAASVAGSMIAYLPAGWRFVWAAGWVGVVGFGAITDPSFTAFGHAIALAIGLTLGTVFLQRVSKPLNSNEIDRSVPSTRAAAAV